MRRKPRYAFTKTAENGADGIPFVGKSKPLRSKVAILHIASRACGQSHQREHQMIKPALFFAALALAFPVLADDLYKCQAEDGQITYSSEPCPKAEKTIKKIAPGETRNFTIVPAEKVSQPSADTKALNADNKKCAAYGEEIRDIDSRLSHGFVAGEEEQLKARRKQLADAAYQECFGGQR
jgi:hypothetical protein